MIEFRSWLLRNHSREVSHKALAYLHSMILELVSRQIIAHDIVAGVSVSSTSRYDEPISIPTEREIDSLLSAADKLANSKNVLLQKTWRRYRPILTSSSTQACVRMNTLSPRRAGCGIRELKLPALWTAAGRKSLSPRRAPDAVLIDLNPDMVAMIRHYADNHAVANKHDLLFPCRNGNWITRRHWSRHGFQRVCEEAGLMITVEEDGASVERPKYSPYDLRHFYASMLIDNRVNLKRIQTLMRHEDIKTTLNVYGHLIERVEAAAEEKTSVLTL
jgi:integrase